MHATSLLVLGIFLVVLHHARSYISWRTRSRGRPLPPGPKPLPIIGNLCDWPKAKQAIALRDICAKHGDIVHFSLLGLHVVVLGSPAAVFECLEKKSANTSSRIGTPVIELSGLDSNFSLIPYGRRWREHKRTFWQYFHPKASIDHRPAQKLTTRRLLAKLLRRPSELEQHVHFTFSAALIKVLYGFDAVDDDDDLVGMVEVVTEWIRKELVPGKYLVEIFPFLKYLPSWFPGGIIKKRAVYWRATTKLLKDEPFRRVRAAMGKHGSEAPPSVVSDMLTRIDESKDENARKEEREQLCKDVITTTFEAGSETVAAAAQFALLALSLHPEARKKAQAELDAVVGPNRLPDFDDRDGLVYVNALLKECLRWRTAVPLGLPHVTVEDDELRGHFIPAGTVIHANIWACTHDPEVYEHPDEFRPERFIRDGKLDPTVPDPATFVFGFGRRMCPGRYFADNALFITIASVLHVFDVGPPLDEKGQAVQVIPESTNEFISFPVDFRVTVKPRSAAAEALILSGTQGIGSD